MSKLMKKIMTISLGTMLALSSFGAVWAAESPVIELSFDGKNYEAGDIATAEVIVYNTSYNVLGFSLSYGENVIVVDENGETSDAGDVLVRMEDVMYRGEGIYSILNCSVSDGNIKTTVYVNPGSEDEDVKDNSVTVGSEGRKVATISFKMTEAGIPDVDFATQENDAEFGTTPFFMLDSGTQPAGSKAQIRYIEPEKKPADDEKKNDTDNKTNEGNDALAPDKTAEPESSVIVSTVVDNTDPTVTGSDGTDISHIVNQPEDAPLDADDAKGGEKELSPTERIMGIAVLGVAFGFTGGVVLKKIMAGAKKED